MPFRIFAVVTKDMTTDESAMITRIILWFVLNREWNFITLLHLVETWHQINSMNSQFGQMFLKFF
jgi:hypothetical protein